LLQGLLGQPALRRRQIGEQIDEDADSSFVLLVGKGQGRFEADLGVGIAQELAVVGLSGLTGSYHQACDDDESQNAFSHDDSKNAVEAAINKKS
jgi:hypothetical protein